MFKTALKRMHYFSDKSPVDSEREKAFWRSALDTEMTQLIADHSHWNRSEGATSGLEVVRMMVLLWSWERKLVYDRKKVA